MRCFANIAKRLRPGGLFLIEAFVPDPTRFTGGQIIQAMQVEVGGVKLEVSRHDPLTQRTFSQQVLITKEGIQNVTRVTALEPLRPFTT